MTIGGNLRLATDYLQDLPVGDDEYGQRQEELPQKGEHSIALPATTFHKYRMITTIVKHILVPHVHYFTVKIKCVEKCVITISSYLLWCNRVVKVRK